MIAMDESILFVIHFPEKMREYKCYIIFFNAGLFADFFFQRFIVKVKLNKNRDDYPLMFIL